MPVLPLFHKEKPANFPTPQASNASTEIVNLPTNVHCAGEPTLPSGASILKHNFNPLPELAPTPVKVEQLELELSEYEPLLKQSLLSSLRKGFDIG